METVQDFTKFGSFPGGLRKSRCRFTDTFCGGIFIAIFAKVTENECVMHRWSHCDRLSSLQYYLLIATFKFDCKSDFTMLKFL